MDKDNYIKLLEEQNRDLIRENMEYAELVVILNENSHGKIDEAEYKRFLKQYKKDNPTSYFWNITSIYISFSVVMFIKFLELMVQMVS